MATAAARLLLRAAARHRCIVMAIATALMPIVALVARMGNAQEMITAHALVVLKATGRVPTARRIVTVVVPAASNRVIAALVPEHPRATGRAPVVRPVVTVVVQKVIRAIVDLVPMVLLKEVRAPMRRAVMHRKLTLDSACSHIDAHRHCQNLRLLTPTP